MKIDINKIFDNKKGRYFRFFLYIIIIIFINLDSQSLFLRFDLTSRHLYSLSKASIDVVSSLREPLTIKVFFTKNLPAPYNGVERYLKDLLQEYALKSNHLFNYEFYDAEYSDVHNNNDNKETEKPENYGIVPQSIQILENDEMKIKKAYMGMVFLHGDIAERIQSIASSDGLEYRITTKIQGLNNQVSALLSADKKINVKLFVSSSLTNIASYMDLKGFSDLPGK